MKHFRVLTYFLFKKNLQEFFWRLLKLGEERLITTKYTNHFEWISCSIIQAKNQLRNSMKFEFKLFLVLTITFLE